MTFPRLLSYLLVFLLIGCSASPLNRHASSGPGGIGGTGNFPSDHSGIGGTGRTLDEGLGGTGRVAKGGDEGGIGGTGIVGTITAFGSIWVNDAHVHFDETTPITINQSPATSGELQLGQVVAVNSMARGDAFQANSIDIVHEVVGPIHTLMLNEGKLEVLNQDVLFEESTVFFDTESQSELKTEQLLAGAFVEVSGLRQSDGDIVASRIDIIEAPEHIQLIGELEQNADGKWQINDQIVEIDSVLMPEGIDKRVLISGHLEGDYLIAESLDRDSIETVLEEVSELIYEGYYFEEEMDGFVTIGGVEFAIEDAIEFSEDHDFDSPLRVNASLSEDGMYAAEDLLVEYGEDFHDLIHEHEEDFEHEGEWHEEDYFEEQHLDEEGYEEHEEHEEHEYDEHDDFEDHEEYDDHDFEEEYHDEPYFDEYDEYEFYEE